MALQPTCCPEVGRRHAGEVCLSGLEVGRRHAGEVCLSGLEVGRRHAGEVCLSGLEVVTASPMVERVPRLEDGSEERQSAWGAGLRCDGL